MTPSEIIITTIKCLIGSVIVFILYAAALETLFYFANQAWGH